MANTKYDYGERGWRHHLSDGYSLHRDVAKWHLEHLGLFRQTVESLLVQEDGRLSELHLGNPEDYDGGYLEDIVAAEMRRSFVCTLMNVVVRLLERHCACVAACLQLPELSAFKTEHVKKAQGFLENLKGLASSDERWILLQGFWAIRNMITHTGAETTPYPTDEQEKRKLRQNTDHVRPLEALFISKTGEPPGSVLAKDSSITVSEALSAWAHSELTSLFETFGTELVKLCKDQQGVAYRPRTTWPGP